MSLYIALRSMTLYRRHDTDMFEHEIRQGDTVTLLDASLKYSEPNRVLHNGRIGFIFLPYVCRTVTDSLDAIT